MRAPETRESVFSPQAFRPPEISVVLPVYGNQDTLEELYRQLRHVLETGFHSYELLFVDDASLDDSLQVLQGLARADARVAVLALEKNLGQQRAVLVGLSQARGGRVVVMDADRQDPPQAIPSLLDKLQEGPAAVFAGRCGWYESPFRLFTSRLFKWVLHKLCGVPADAGLFVAMNRAMVGRLLAFDQTQPFVIAMMGCSGLPLASVPVVRARRPGGGSAYSFWDRLAVGCRALSWVLRWKWGSGNKAPSPPVPGISMRVFGARFAQTSERILTNEGRS